MSRRATSLLVVIVLAALPGTAAVCEAACAGAPHHAAAGGLVADASAEHEHHHEPVAAQGDTTPQTTFSIQLADGRDCCAVTASIATSAAGRVDTDFAAPSAVLATSAFIQPPLLYRVVPQRGPPDHPLPTRAPRPLRL